MRKKKERKRSIHGDNTNVLTKDFKMFPIKRFGEQVSLLIISVNKLKSENTIFNKLPNEVMWCQISMCFIRELVEDGTLTLEFIHTNDQKANLFTKPLDSKRFEFLRQNIGVISTGWSLFLLLLPHAFASSFYALACLTCFCLFLFSFALFF